jgi:hypothetical protein
MKNLLITILLGMNFLAAQQPELYPGELCKPRMRVIIINDFGGDPDGIFQLVHQVLSPSAEIRGIIGSHIKGVGFFGVPESASYACEKANEVLDIMNLKEKLPVYKGADSALADSKTARISDGANAIVKEAMREDTKTPLYILCGAGLTDAASAYLIQPEIAGKFTLIWIGGPEYNDLAYPPPDYSSEEYNLSIDLTAAQVLFNESEIPVWQIPRDAYRQPLISYPELLLKVKTQGKIGEYLAASIENVMKMADNGRMLGETYILGDTPLVLLSALQSPYNADPSSSKYVIIPAPVINDSGLYKTNQSGRNIRIYTGLDVRLMLDDFFMKLILFNSMK